MNAQKQLMMKEAMVLLVKVFGVDHWVVEEVLMSGQLSFVKELLGGESLSW